MAFIARTGFVALTVSLAIGFTSGCSSSDVGAIGGRLSDASTGGSTSSGGATSGGGVGATGGKGGGGIGIGGAAGGSAGNGGSTAGAGGATSGADGGHPPCKADADCTGLGLRCDVAAKVCVECLFDNECAQTARCQGGTCTPLLTCTNSRDCRNNADGRTICSTDTKLCVQCAGDVDCANHQICAVDTCVDSATCQVGAADGGTGCSVGEVCGAGGKCVECVTSKDCTAGKTCIGSACRTPCVSDNACKAGNQLCDTKLGACVDCTADKDCAALEYCASGLCKPDVCAQGVKSCVGNAVVQCTANGDGILAPVACAAGEKCVAKGRSASCEVPTLPDGGTPPPATCGDKTKNGDETDVDCGGKCPDCAQGKTCTASTDCASGVCEASCSGLLCFPGTRTKVCRSAACNDTVKNGDETDVDCGGGSCKRCVVGDKCTANADCEADLCKAGICVAAPCTASQCAPCFLPTDKACCQPSGLCGCAAVFPIAGACQ